MPTDPIAQARREGIAEGLEMAAKVAADMEEDQRMLAGAHAADGRTAYIAASSGEKVSRRIAAAIRALKDGGSDGR